MNKSNDQDLRNVRVANFSEMELPFANTLNFDSEDVDANVAKIRNYADLPYLYVLSDRKEKSVRAILKKLKSIRSTCFPYALFLSEGVDVGEVEADADLIRVADMTSDGLIQKITDYAAEKFTFDRKNLMIENDTPIPEKVDVMIVGAGITGLLAADKFLDNNLTCCVAEKSEAIGGIWSQYANTVSQVNTSECAYRLIEPKIRTNRDHSMTREILSDMVCLARKMSDRLYLNTEVIRIAKVGDGYRTELLKDGQKYNVESKGIILAVNDRVGSPRVIEWENQAKFKGQVVNGISDEAKEVDWKNKRVVIIGMGAFAIENTRTALEAGAEHVTVVCRRHGTVCPKIIDYLNFSTPYDDDFQHEKKSNMRNMMLWKKLYNLSGATQPECWMGKIKHTGHTISVSDIWFIAHYLKKLETVAGNISGMNENGVVVDKQHHIDADIVVNCIGFHRNASNINQLCDYTEMYNNNYIDKDFMYLADAYIDDDAFNSFFGSSVLEMEKFYLNVYLRFFNNPEFDQMLNSSGIQKIAIEDRSWSHYIKSSNALTKRYPELYQAAKQQVAERTENFMESHDLETFVSANMREWYDMHSLLAGRQMAPEDCLPYVFERLVTKAIL